MDRSQVRTIAEALAHGGLLAARARVTEETPCAGCGETMEDEFLTFSIDDNEILFDGVLNDAGEPFHHGCEDF